MRREFSVQRMADEHGALYDRLLERPRASQAQPEVASLEPIRLPRTTPPDRSVSVIMPCFRHGAYLEQAIGSVFAQTHEVQRDHRRR